MRRLTVAFLLLSAGVAHAQDPPPPKPPPPTYFPWATFWALKSSAFPVGVNYSTLEVGTSNNPPGPQIYYDADGNACVTLQPSTKYTFYVMDVSTPGWFGATFKANPSGCTTCFYDPNPTSGVIYFNYQTSIAEWIFTTPANNSSDNVSFLWAFGPFNPGGGVAGGNTYGANQYLWVTVNKVSNPSTPPGGSGSGGTSPPPSGP